jgi:hypothetical protein
LVIFSAGAASPRWPSKIARFSDSSAGVPWNTKLPDEDNIDVVRYRQREFKVLLDKQNGNAALAQAARDFLDALKPALAKALRKVRPSGERWIRHQCTADREHLLLAAGERTSRAVEPFLELRKLLQHLAQIPALASLSTIVVILSSGFIVVMQRVAGLDLVLPGSGRSR